MRKTGPSYHSESQILFLPDLLAQISEGALQVPRFQRPFVWTDEQRLTLLESVKRGIPIGSILLWRTRRHQLKSFQHLGPHLLNSRTSPQNGSRTYLLDGNQRLSTLFGALWPSSPSDVGDGQDIDQADVDWDIFYDLLDQEFLLRGQRERKAHWLPLSIALDSVSLLRFQRKLPESKAEVMIRAADELASAIRTFKIPVITIVTDDLTEVTRTFQRINSQGTRMDQVHMITALTWDPKFDLSERIVEMKEQMLDPIGWGELDDKTIINVCKAALDLDVYEADVEIISDALKNRTEVLEQAGRNLAITAGFLREKCGIYSPQLVPYSHQIVLLAEAFRVHKVSQEKLYCRAKSWLWMTTYAGVFAGINYSRLRSELKFVRMLALREAPVKKLPTGLSEMTQLPKRFDMRAARIKALVIRLAELQPMGQDSRRINGFEELERHYSAALIHLIERSKLKNKLLFASPANRVLADPADARWFRHFTESSPLFGAQDMRQLGKDFLQSHAITTEAAAALAKGQYERFLEHRLEKLARIEKDFVDSMGSSLT